MSSIRSNQNQKRGQAEHHWFTGSILQENMRQNVEVFFLHFVQSSSSDNTFLTQVLLSVTLKWSRFPLSLLRPSVFEQDVMMSLTLFVSEHHLMVSSGTTGSALQEIQTSWWGVWRSHPLTAPQLLIGLLTAHLNIWIRLHVCFIWSDHVKLYHWNKLIPRWTVTPDAW